eukprot:15334740-Alexandrium_andersonii.AAC.1
MTRPKALLLRHSPWKRPSVARKDVRPTPGPPSIHASVARRQIGAKACSSAGAASLMALAAAPLAVSP